MKWKFVPVDPDDNMTQAGLSRFVDRLSGVADIYDAMLAAAPDPEPCVWKELHPPTRWHLVTCMTNRTEFLYEPLMKFCPYCGHPLKVVAHE